jgi:hypothetical protein
MNSQMRKRRTFLWLKNCHDYLGVFELSIEILEEQRRKPIVEMEELIGLDKKEEADALKAKSRVRFSRIVG